MTCIVDLFSEFGANSKHRGSQAQSCKGNLDSLRGNTFCCDGLLQEMWGEVLDINSFLCRLLILLYWYMR